jgi:hypothetical protein
MLQGPALARAEEVQDALEELAEKHGVSVSQLRIVNYMRILKPIFYQDIALDALREMLPRIRLPDGTTNGNILEYWGLTLALAQDLAFLVGASDETLLPSLICSNVFGRLKGKVVEDQQDQTVFKAYLADRERLGSLERDA